MAEGKAIPKQQTQTQVIRHIAEKTELPQKVVAEVLEALHCVVHSHLKKRGSGVIVLPKLGIKVRRVKKPARSARMARNPRTGEMVKVAAKPAHQAVKLTALKAVKDLIN